MTILERLKAALETPLKDYEKRFKDYPNRMPKEDVVAIADIRAMLAEANHASLLLKQVASYTHNSMRGKFFGFLPFVSDLKRELLNVLNEPDFHLGNVLAEESAEMFQMNARQRVELDQLKNSDHSINQLRQEIQQLRDDLAIQKAAIKLLTEERDALLLQNKKLQDAVDDHKQRAETAETTIKQMESNQFKLVDENTTLYAKVLKLEQKLLKLMQEQQQSKYRQKNRQEQRPGFEAGDNGSCHDNENKSKEKQGFFKYFRF